MQGRQRRSFTEAIGGALIITFAVLFEVPPANCNPINARDIEAKMVAMASDVLKQADDGARVQTMRELSLFVRGQDRTTLGDLGPEAVDAIASLLSDKLVEIRSRAATVLGEIGPTASRAVPALENALKYQEPGLRVPTLGQIGPSGTAEIEIRDALEKIRGK